MAAQTPRCLVDRHAVVRPQDYPRTVGETRLALAIASYAAELTLLLAGQADNVFVWFHTHLPPSYASCFMSGRIIVGELVRHGTSMSNYLVINQVDNVPLSLTHV